MNKVPVLQFLYEFVEFERVAVPCLVLDTKHTKTVDSKQMDNGFRTRGKVTTNSSLVLRSQKKKKKKDLGTRLQS